MSVINATIQNRRGEYSKYDPSKQAAGELAIVQSGDPNTPDGFAMYVHGRSGMVGRHRVVTANEIDPYMVDIHESVAEATKQASDSADSATLSESWAIGSTGTREGENTDNSKFYSEESNRFREMTKGYYDFLNDLFGGHITTPSFTVDLESGHMIADGVGAIGFFIDNNSGHLLWEASRL